MTKQKANFISVSALKSCEHPHLAPSPQQLDTQTQPSHNKTTKNLSMASQYDPDKTRSETWRNQLSGLFQLIAEHVKEVDESALHTRLTTLLSLNGFTSSLRTQLQTALSQVALWADDPDSVLMKDRIFAVISYVPTFPTTRVDTLVPFLSSVYHFCSHDDFPLTKVIGCLQELIAISRPATPVRRTSVARADILATPVKPTSSSPYSPMSTLEDVTPQLENELKRHLWFSTSDNMSFFDHFFPEINNLPTPEPFPLDPQQSRVITWFEVYDQRCREEVKTLKGCKWMLKTSANQPLSHPTVKRKLDLFLYNGESESSANTGVTGLGHDGMGINQSAGTKGCEEEKHDWKYVLVIAELKCEKKLTDLHPKPVLQLAGYVRHVFHRQPDRQFVHGFSIINSTLRCWVYTRSGAFASSSVNLKTPRGLSVFCRVYNGYLNMSLEELGFAVAPTASTVTVGGREIIRGEPFFATHAIVTRGTTCWTARPKDVETTEAPWVLKVSWRYPGREHEGIMLQSSQKCGVKGVAEYIAHDQGLSVHEILGDHYIKSAVALDLRWKINKGRSPYSLLNSSTKSCTPTAAAASKAPSVGENLRGQLVMISTERQQPHDPPRDPPRDPPYDPPGYPHKKAKSSNTHDSSPQLLPSLRNSTEERQMTGEYEPVDNEEVGSAAAVGAAEIPVPDRISTWVLISRGKPVDEFTDPVELLLAMRDAVRGHRSLLIDGHILHRDISVNNIMITTASRPRTDGFHGFLIDLDHAIGADAIGRHSSVPERTGTFEFMSIDALWRCPDFRHIYYDDLQSFMWVFLWLIIKGSAGCPALEDWSGNFKPRVIGDIKAVQIGSEKEFEFRLARWLDKDLGVAVGKAAKDLRRALFPVGERKELEREDVRDRLYEKVIKAFDDALAVAEEEAKTLKKRVVVPRDRMAN